MIPICCYVKKRKEALIAREQEFKAVIARENQQYFQSRDIRWTVGRYGAWLTIELDYIARKMNQGIMGGLAAPAPGMQAQNPGYTFSQPGLPGQVNNGANNGGYAMAKPNGQF